MLSLDALVHRCRLLMLLALLTAFSFGFPASVHAADSEETKNASVLHEMTTSAGIPFLLRGEKGKSPRPTILCLAMTGSETLTTSPYRSSGIELAKNGWLVVSLDIPGHGTQHRAGEPAGIAAWRTRIEKSDPYVDELATRVSAMLDFLIKNGYTDPSRIAVEGTSRGGFLAAHMAAREPRFKAVIMYAPVCDLADVTEFHRIEKNPRLQALALAHLAPKLADRRIWVIIGNDDNRVNTDRAIQFTREVVHAAKQKKLAPAVTLSVTATPGHSSTEEMHHQAVLWLLQQLPGSRP